MALQKNSTDLISIVIPVRNEEDFIRANLESILKNGYPVKKLDIIICDGQSKDHTRSIAEELRKRNPCIRILENTDTSTPAGLNLGIGAARGDVIMILGGHAELTHGYLQSCHHILKSDSSIGCVGGRIENQYQNSASAAIGYAMNSSFGVGNAYFRTGIKSGFVDTVAYGMYTREVINTVGSFNEKLIRNQDDDFNYRVTQAGIKIYLDNNLKIKYYSRASLKRLWSQYYQYGYWKAYLNKIHKRFLSLRQIVPFLFVLFLFQMPVTSILHSALFLANLLILLAYISISILFSLASGRRFMMVLLSYFCLHLSYGLGYLDGFARFLILQRDP